MKKYERWMVYPLSVTGIIIALFALCPNHPRESGFDYIGVIVGILALLVTVLIGWNIYSAVGIKEEWRDFQGKVNNEIDKIKALDEDIEKIKEEREKLKKYIKANRNYVLAINESYEQKYGRAVVLFCSVIINIYDLDKKLLNISIGQLHKITSNYDISKNNILQKEKEHFIKELTKINDKRIENIVAAIRKAYPDEPAND